MSFQGRPNKRREKTKKPLTEASLEFRALAYAERFSTTGHRMRAVLERAIRRSALPEDAERLRAAAEKLVERLIRAGVVNEERFGEARASRLHRQGHSARAIGERLRVAGLSSEQIQRSIAEAGAGGLEGERAAARAYAKKRRLGAFRGEDPAPFRQKDLAAMARRGFSRRVSEEILGRGEDE
ncbi:MAG: RecX family transcriptional regulator [Myxococcota bacterium]